MGALAVDRNAFIRPSPSAGTLGGVARKTRESMLLCEAAGYDVVIVETVGVGQSETVVADMVDVFVALMLPGAGDELQGIKKGLLEIAEILFVNKADGENETRARRAARDLEAALHLFAPVSPHWSPTVLTGSGLTGAGIDKLWETVTAHRKALEQRRRARRPSVAASRCAGCGPWSKRACWRRSRRPGRQVRLQASWSALWPRAACPPAKPPSDC
jgi:LAO/AO transport system kinase